MRRKLIITIRHQKKKKDRNDGSRVEENIYMVIREMEH